MLRRGVTPDAGDPELEAIAAEATGGTRFVPYRVEWLRLDELEPHDRNTNSGDAGAVADAVDTVGFVGPVLVQDATRTPSGKYRLIDGETRYHDLVRRGAPSVPCWIVDVDDAHALRILAGWNRIGRLGRDRPDELAGLLRELADGPGGLAGTGFDGDDLDMLLRDLEEPFAPPPPESVEPSEPPAVPVTRPGDLWVLGEHRVLCGDAVKDTRLLMRDELAALMWTDPPYGVDYVGKTANAMTITNDDRAGLPELLRGVFAAADAALEPGAAIYIAHPPGERSLVFFQAFTDIGWSFRQNLVWLKDSMVLGHSDYHYKHEPIMYGYKPTTGRRGRGGEGWYGDNSQTSVFEVPKPARSESHPTMKPVALVEHALRNSSPAGAVVLDPFAGSGTTLIAAENLGRHARLIEIDPGYVDVIVKRWTALTGGDAVRESDGAKWSELTPGR